VSTPAPRDAVVVVIERDGRFLFVRRAPHVPAPGTWCPVSGRVEPGETQRGAVRREAREELDVEVVADEKLDELPTADGAFRLHYWRATLRWGEPRVASDEVTDLGWFTVEQLRVLPGTFADDVRVCEAAARGRAQAGEVGVPFAPASRSYARGGEEVLVTTRSNDASRAPDAVLDRLRAPSLRGVVGVLRSDDAARATAQAEAAIDAGLACVEITWTTPGAADVVRDLRERHPRLLLGAGSVFDDEQAAEAVAAGAEFVVGPHLSEAVSAACAAMDVLYVPGAATPTEVVRAMELGHPLVKLFPIAQLGGPGFVRALLGPIPALRALVTGGVDAGDVDGYLDAGAALVGLGSIFALDEAETRRRVHALFARA
jgi:2-dehydro-3-deoxyphosphogluconate aldolase / (4S)-4-hydroxy-2-oxoglutarate aldolase